MVPRVNIMLLAAIIVGSFVALIVLLEHGDYAGLGRGSVLDSFLAATHTKHLQDEPPFRRLQNVPTGHILATSPQSAISGHHFNHSISHKRAWMHLEEVDGLKNEEVVMVVTSTVTREGYFLRERIIASSRTWMRLFANAIVVIEDTFEIRFAMRSCIMVDYEQYTTFSCHNEPTYLLSRKCNDEYYGADGPCCKVDDAINFIVNVRPDFFAQIKFMLHCDDDMYWRPDQVLRWLASVQNSGINKYPLIANLEHGNEDSRGVWMVENCKEVMTSGWYQPAMLNHALLARMGAGAAAYGLRDTCRVFDVTHDVGLGIYAWLYGASHIHMPATNGNPEHKGMKVFRPADMAMHYVKHHESEHCDGAADNGWGTEDIHKQNVVIGCGDLDHPIPGHDKKKRADMYDAWNYYKANGVDIVLNEHRVNEYEHAYVVVSGANDTRRLVHVLHSNSVVKAHGDGTFTAERIVLFGNISAELQAGERIEQRTVPHMVHLQGYETTSHSKLHDITKKWKAFTLEDCSPPGKKAKE